MGALPKRKISKSRRDRRRGHDKLKKAQLFACDDADGMMIPHRLRRAAATPKGRKLLGLDDDSE
ncbi:MAG: 50S ribosomal protein L32 [Chloroflexota bacterium]